MLGLKACSSTAGCIIPVGHCLSLSLELGQGPARSREHPTSAPHAEGLALDHAGFYAGAGNLNSHPQVQLELLPPEPSPGQESLYQGLKTAGELFQASSQH